MILLIEEIIQQRGQFRKIPNASHLRIYRKNLDKKSRSIDICFRIKKKKSAKIATSITLNEKTIIGYAVHTVPMYMEAICGGVAAKQAKMQLDA